MNRVVQHLPGFVDLGRAVVEAGDIAALEALPFVKVWTNEHGFRRLSVCSDLGLRAPWGGPSLVGLMAEFDNGAVWYVVAGLEDPALYDLPEWAPAKVPKES